MKHLNYQQPFLLTAKSAMNAKRERKDRDGAKVLAILCVSFAFLAVNPLQPCLCHATKSLFDGLAHQQLNRKERRERKEGTQRS